MSSLLRPYSVGDERRRSGLGAHRGGKNYIDQRESFRRDIEKLTLAKFGAAFIENPGGGPSGKSITFGGETTALTERLREIGCELYCAGGMMSMTRGSFTREAEELNIPLFSLSVIMILAHRRIR